MSQIAKYLGRSSTAVTERTYARYAPDHLRQAAQILDFGKKKRTGCPPRLGSIDLGTLREKSLSH